MQLIGMLDSPYVRRVAISLQFLGLPFEHRSISVFRAFAEFRQINPVVKAPTLVCDDGVVLMDSTLILDYAETLAAPRKSLMPTAIGQRRDDLKIIGLALVACEKAVQIIYERNLRPTEKQHQPWLDRVSGQLLTALAELESEIARRPKVIATSAFDQATITSAVAWHFIQQTLAEVVAAARHPGLCELSAQAEATAEFSAAPHGDSTFRA
jgi:glutathione S-transferase